MHPYWKKQQLGKPLFPDIEWNKPERRDQAGKLLVVGGNKLGFSAVAEAYQTAKDSGAGQVRVLVPDCLKSSIPKIIDGVIFAACNTSGGLSSDAKTELLASAAWADGILLIGDAGRNSETAVLYEQFLQEYTGPLTITRDAIDLVRNDSRLLVDRPDTTIIASFAQLQKLFQGVYYPKVLTFSIQLLQLVEALHKFTITYPSTIMTLHKDTMIIAKDGDVITQPWGNPMSIWRGNVAANVASNLLWNPEKILQATAYSIAK